MSSYLLEGESFFVLDKLDSLIENKKIELNPMKLSNTLSLFRNVDYYVFIDPDKQTIENINCDNFIVCFMDKNIDLRLDYIKKIKNKSEYHCFEPIPTTDFDALREIFPEIKSSNFLPSKKFNLKYKGSKQNYEWYDLSLIADLLTLNDQGLFEHMNDTFFDIWKFSDLIWSGNPKCVEQIIYINDKNFEDYFNRIRETSKDYLEILQTNAKNFNEHKKLMPNTSLLNEYRFNKVKEKLNLIDSNHQIDIIYSFDICLKNVRSGSNPKLELLKLFFNFKKYVSK
jgi:hypothetical protein